MELEEGMPLWRLQKLPLELGQLLHKIIDGICGGIYPLYQDYLSVWDFTEWTHVLEDITQFFKAMVGESPGHGVGLYILSQTCTEIFCFHSVFQCLLVTWYSQYPTLCHWVLC